MSLADVKEQIEALSEEERLQLAAWLKVERLQKDDAFRERLAQARDRNEAGGGVALEKLNDFHDALKREGL